MAQYQEISNHPEYGFKRAVDLDKTEIWISLKSQTVELRLEVVHFIDDTVITIVPPIIVPLIANNSTNVDPNTGIPLPDGEPGVPEFTFLRAAMGTPVVIDDMISGKIQWADAIGRFNQ